MPTSFLFQIALNEINSLKYPAPISTKNAEEALERILFLKTTDEALICKIFLLLKNLISRQKVSISHQLLFSLNLWVIKFVPAQPVEALNLLALLLRGVHPIEKEVLVAIFAKNLPQLIRKGRLDETTLAIFRLIDLLCPEIFQNFEEFIDQLLEIEEIGLELLQNVETDLDFAFRVLNIARHVVHFYPEWAEDGKLPLLVGCFKAFVCDGTKAVVAIQPAQQSLPEDGTGAKKPNTTKPIKANKKKPRANGLKYVRLVLVKF